MASKTTVKGFVGRDPRSNNVNGKQVLNVSVADTVNRDDETVWYDVALWEERAERHQGNVGKGDLVWFTGSIKGFRVYQDNRGGQQVSLKVSASDFMVVQKAADRPQRQQQGQRSQQRSQQGGQQGGRDLGWGNASNGGQQAAQGRQWGSQQGNHQGNRQGGQQGGQQRNHQGGQWGGGFAPDPDPNADPIPF